MKKFYCLWSSKSHGNYANDKTKVYVNEGRSFSFLQKDCWQMMFCCVSVSQKWLFRFFSKPRQDSCPWVTRWKTKPYTVMKIIAQQMIFQRHNEHITTCNSKWDLLKKANQSDKNFCTNHIVSQWVHYVLDLS